MAALREVSENRSFGGYQKVFEHDSSACSGPMRFAIYLPPQAETQHVPVLYFLSGLTCTEQNFIQKSGFQRSAAEHGIAVVTSDTSPRNCNIPGENDSWDLGSGASFYVDATEEPWKNNYRMQAYITSELPALIQKNFKVIPSRQSICGHSMGGHGALICALKNPGMYQSVSAFSPIAYASKSNWGQKAFTAYLGKDRSKWEAYDATLLAPHYKGPDMSILIDQGLEDEWYQKGELDVDAFFDAASKATKVGSIAINLRKHSGYDHSYFFIATFMADHIAFHSKALKAEV